MADKVHELRPKAADTEKITINLGYIDLGHIDLMVQVGAFLTLSLGLFVVFSCVLYFNLTLPPRYRPNRWAVAGGILTAVVLLLCAIGGSVGLARKLMANL